jgi:ribosomal RNA-processing protein 9
VSRKKPVYTKRFAHGHHTNIINTNEGGTTVASDIRLQQDQNQSANQEKIVKGEPRWITAVAAQPFTDLVASGSSDGFIRLWKVSPNWKSLDPVDTIEMVYFSKKSMY